MGKASATSTGNVRNNLIARSKKKQSAKKDTYIEEENRDEPVIHWTENRLGGLEQLQSN